MKRLIYMLLLFVVLGHTVFAQEQKAEPLEVRLLDGFFPLGADWYRAQKDAWQVELKKDKRNEKAWENYWVACNAEYQEAKSAGAKIAKGTTWHREENEEVDS